MFKSVKNLGFLEVFFRFTCMLFWPLYWYKWSVITIANYNEILFNIYLVVSGLFLIVCTMVYIIKKSTTGIYYLYRMVLILTYLESLYSFMVVPRNIEALYVKIILCVLLLLVSNKLIKKDKNDTGVVGILSSILILVLTYFYYQ